MISKIAKYLKENNYKLSIAESCTGGLISSMFTDVSGASNYIEKNFVTYSNKAKVEILDINPEVIEKYTVTSAVVAKDMAGGLIQKWGADFALSTTGMVDGVQKPFCYIGYSHKNKTQSIYFESDKKTRKEIKEDMAQRAIEFLWEKINEENC